MHSRLGYYGALHGCKAALAGPMRIRRVTSVILMHFQEEIDVTCPYCGEGITLLVDPSVPRQSYTEDCQVCCRPILVDTRVDQTGEVTIRIRQEDE